MGVVAGLTGASASLAFSKTSSTDSGVGKRDGGQSVLIPAALSNQRT